MYARNEDPDSSHDAADELLSCLSTRRVQFLKGLRELGAATANEVGVHVAGSKIGLVGSTRRRASDLEKLGYIRVIGHRECKVTGKRVHVYEEFDFLG